MKCLAVFLIALAIGLAPLTLLAFKRGASDSALVLVAPAAPVCTSYRWEI